jgi:hypothetical protein
VFPTKRATLDVWKLSSICIIMYPVNVVRVPWQADVMPTFSSYLRGMYGICCLTYEYKANRFVEYLQVNTYGSVLLHVTR